MKKLLSALSNLPVHDDKILIVLCSLTKMFVGQIIQESRRVASEMRHFKPRASKNTAHAPRATCVRSPGATLRAARAVLDSSVWSRLLLIL